MRKVHWSVWGLLGFFGMLVVGLWIDSYWLPGVGIVSPATVISPPVPVRQVQERVAIPPCEEEQTEDTDPFHDGAAAAWEDKSANTGLEAPEIIGGGLEIPTDEPAAELLPEPETEGIPSASSLPPSIPDAPPARDPAVTSEPVRPSTSDAKCPAPPPSGADDRDGQINAIVELLKPSRVMSSREFAPDAQSQAQYMREVAEAVLRNLEQDRAAAPPDLPPPRSPLDLTIPPTPPSPEPIPANAASPEQVEALRGASRQLDEIANQLEQQGLYPRADQVRGLSQEMRIDARKGLPHRSPGASVPPSQYHAPGSLRPSGDQPYNPYENALPTAPPASGN